MTQTPVQIDHLNLTVKKFSQTVEWYEKTFGFELVEKGMTPEDLPWGILKSGPTMLCIYEDPNLKGPEHLESSGIHYIAHFGLRISNEDEWKKKIKDLSLKVFYSGAVRYPRSTSWYVQDPTGYEIEVALWDNNQISFS